MTAREFIIKILESGINLEKEIVISTRINEDTDQFFNYYDIEWVFENNRLILK